MRDGRGRKNNDGFVIGCSMLSPGAPPHPPIAYEYDGYEDSDGGVGLKHDKKILPS